MHINKSEEKLNFENSLFFYRASVRFKL